MITTLFRTPVRPSISERWDGLSVSTIRPAHDRKPIAGAVRRKDQKQNVALAIHLFCLRLQCCSKRFDSRVAARFCVGSYNHRVTPEPICDDLRCTGCLAPKNAFIAKQTE